MTDVENKIKGDLLYEGKAKRIYSVLGEPERIFQDFKNSLTALNGQKKGEFSNKGELNRSIASLIFRYLSKKGLTHHWIQDVGSTGMVTQKLQMVPLEVVVRNVAAGSLAKKFGWPEGKKLSAPLVELYYKDDALGDPFISDEQALLLSAATIEELKELKRLGLLVNEHLSHLFEEIGLQLIDFKLEFGRTLNGSLLLADEITPDTCRLWDLKSGEKMDKDRFRRDLGNIQETYEEVLNRLKKLNF